MGGSLRRHKKHNPRIKKKANKKATFRKSEPPVELVAQRPDLKRKLGVDATWEAQDHAEENYARLGFVADANAGFGRNRKPDLLQQKIERDPSLLEAEPDDDLKAACAETRSSGKAPPKRLTPHQRQIVERLVEAHGEDTRAMLHDRRLNPMQHSEGALKALIESFQFWKNGAGVDFRVPNKSLW